MARNILIMGAAGKDFHVFNTLYRNAGNDADRVVAFTATQIPDIAGRAYPAALSGAAYPEGVPIFPEEQLEEVIRDRKVEHVVFAYSDIPFKGWIDKRRERVESTGATFGFPDVDATMVASTKPVVAVTAVRTGAGKSQTTRKVAKLLRERGRRVVAVRHPMPYGDLVKQRVQRFASIEDLTKHDCTIEEMEEYEPHIAAGSVVFAGVDYEAILREAEKEADVILWDGGNNDTPFFKPDVWLCVADPLRPGHERLYYPGNVNFERASVIIINKADSATPDGIDTIKKNAAELNPNATILIADSEITVEDRSAIEGKRVLAIEDGPTCTHGDMKTGAASVAATRFGAAELVDPRPYLHGRLKETFEKYPNIGPLLPAMGYGAQQIHDLEQTVNATPCDLVLIGTPIDLGRVIKIDKPHARVRYELAERGQPDLAALLKDL